MSIGKAQMAQNEHKLMLAIGEAIRVQNQQSPLSHEAIVGILAFCSGAALMKVKTDRNTRRQLREMAIQNIDYGMAAMRASNQPASGLILPENYQ